MSNFAVTVTTSSTQILPADVSRQEVYVYNDGSLQVVYIALNTTAASGVGVRLNPGQSWSTKNTSVINAITISGTSNVTGSTV